MVPIATVPGHCLPLHLGVSEMARRILVNIYYET